jgi:ABC-type proline/glycine betaine transport system permease subunit
MYDKWTVLAGAVPAAVMAIVADELLEFIERRLAAR